MAILLFFICVIFIMGFCNASMNIMGWIRLFFVSNLLKIYRIGFNFEWLAFGWTSFAGSVCSILWNLAKQQQYRRVHQPNPKALCSPSYKNTLNIINIIPELSYPYLPQIWHLLKSPPLQILKKYPFFPIHVSNAILTAANG